MSSSSSASAAEGALLDTVPAPATIDASDSSSDSGSDSGSSSSSSSNAADGGQPVDGGAVGGGDEAAPVPVNLPHFYEIVAAYAWAILDVNKDGVIDVQEWVTGVAKLVPTADKAQIKADLRAYDADDNGEIDFSEFAVFMAGWDQSGQAVLREENIRALVDTLELFKGEPAVVDWAAFLSIARRFVPAEAETTVLDEDFGRQLLAAVSLEPDHVNSLTYGEVLVALCTMWHGPPQGATVAYYVRNVWNVDGRS
ncbi:uncharacterized protein AMSG_02413 [Thecamonas trahens ATCC 50062]|uniref:EF-hand domain-containing protein n=1 Tax=Thecamonas trahens ATCC 50062 TaxID=461836 RepID=A0A0L0DY19_THETB|nr:hypothetical protein AMSG_02413 [Thecamonas trahens ATCC 50062]KNC56443.1 hypothetical protein AMSG_02413 [Thecamonas trahens ATCC 50062]|eukprot:XP_013760955.1 hypothetical protein AMSG_02413 [Thecamonas trahens ATCC 50062]